MRPTHYAVLLLFISASTSSQPFDPYEGLDVQAGTVTIDAAKAVTGHWKVIAGAKRSRAEGGACAVVHLNEVWPSAPAVANLNDCIDRSVKVFGTGSYGYFDAGQCWIKPPHGTCNRSLDAAMAQTPTRWDIGDHVTNPVPYSLNVRVGPGNRPFPNKSNWRVIACIFPYDSSGNKLDLDCVWGAPVEIKRHP